MHVEDSVLITARARGHARVPGDQGVETLAHPAHLAG